MIDKAKFDRIMKEEGYMAPQLISGDRWIALRQFLYTVAIVEGNEACLDFGYVRRFCYHNAEEAVTAMVEWMDRGYEDKPKHYITEK